jgi:hypothetical protein
LEALLQRHEAVELVPKNGPPRWFELVQGGNAIVTTNKQGVFRAENWQVALLELIGDTHADRYRFEAEIAHEVSDDAGDVGVYFAREGHQSGEFHIHTFLSASFNDVKDAREFPRLLNAKDPSLKLVVPEGNLFLLQAKLYATDKEELPRWANHSYASSLFEPTLYKTSSEMPVHFRRVALDVTPDQVRAFWEGKPAWTASLTQIRQTIAQTQSQLREESPQHPFAAFDPLFDVRKGLGLYVSNGVAAFRNVTFTPYIDIR